DRVLGAARVRARVRSGGAVAAADVAALQADPQVQPLAAAGEAVLAAVDGLGQLGDVDGVEGGAGHQGASRRIGSKTWNVVAPGSESNHSDPSWRSTTIR